MNNQNEFLDDAGHRGRTYVLIHGAWCGAWFAVEQGVIWVRRVLIAIVIFSATQLLGIWSWVERLL